MNAEIIAVGSELLLGQITNTNATFLSKELADLGINVYYHTVVGDNEKRLLHVIETAQQRSDVIIFTGGLGPTKDDLTKEIVAKVVKRNLVYDETSLQFIENFFKVRKKTMSENNKKQAIVIEDSVVLENHTGLAPGMAFKVDNTHYLLFPGPPNELKPMFLHAGTNYLMKYIDEIIPIQSRVLRYFGIGESQLESDLVDIIEKQSNPTIAPLAGDGEVTLRLTVKHHDQKTRESMLDEVETEINARVGSFFYGYDETSLLQEVVKELVQHSATIACAESLTGGRCSEQLTSLAGASRYYRGGIVSYATDCKKSLLGVSEQMIQQYGVVSEQVALEMAKQIRTMGKANIGISFTGVAGPDKQDGVEVGTVFIGISTETTNNVYPLHLSGTRQQIRNRAVNYGFYYLLKEMKRWN
ncbi:competence/damage-inducible protein A [Alkalihalobacterium bogoriense]|uniref:competence/damage-inducible protein A n=1 Tax=Alkalihalobacterium bogoriense TaxID=246272 RepID=UPI00047AC38B|nr:competence/damage-inducible protein A [Alkalihalobacterium bogoriense]